MERSRRSRLPWGIVLLIVALSCAIAYVAALIYARTADSASFTKVRSLQIDSVSRVEAVSDGLVVYDGSTIRKVSAQSLDGWSYAMGVGADFSASDAGVAAWNDRTLTLIDGSTGVTSYSGSMDETVLSARMGRIYTAALLGPEPVVTSNHHQAVDRLGEGLAVLQRAADGTAECIRHGTLPIWGVQWHPERQSYALRRPDAADGAAVFEAFAAQVEQE